MLHKILNFVRNEEAASAVEYGLIIGLIAVALITVLTMLAGGLEGMFSAVCDQLPGGVCGGEE